MIRATRCFTLLGVWVGLVTTFGCSPPSPVPKPIKAVVTELGANHDPETAGTIFGQIRWLGSVPALTPQIGVVPDRTVYRWIAVTNPFAPQVDPVNHGIDNVLVYLKKVDPTKSKPWDWPPLQVEHRDFRIQLQQGEKPQSLAIVRAGADVQMVSHDPELHTLRARGAAFFSLEFPESNKPLTRSFDRTGIVELTSGAGYYWLAADVLVTEHPYAAITKNDGRFELKAVPSGEYEIVCRVRNWQVTSVETDPETELFIRQKYADPLELTSSITVPAKGRVEQSWTVDQSQFAKTQSRP